MLVPSSTSSLWMLNQLRRATSPHNRFINRRICSRSRAAGHVGEPDRLPRTKMTTACDEKYIELKPISGDVTLSAA
ncbi:hypothetical protein GFL49_38640 [Rhizobium leguminosarum bv. viciae]|nr:hypothetical protein [Rhizobium leguminosarum bv. viciae]